MRDRVVENRAGAEAGLRRGWRSLAYGGARMAGTVLERALRAFPTTDF